MIFVGKGFRHGLLVVDVLDRRQNELGLLVVDSNRNLLKGLLFAVVQREIFGEIRVGDGFKAEICHGHDDVGQFQRQQIHVPLSRLADLVVGQPKRFDLILGQLVRDDAGHFLHAQRFRRLITGVSSHDFMIAVDDQRHQKAEFPDAGRHVLDGLVILARVPGIRMNIA